MNHRTEPGLCEAAMRYWMQMFEATLLESDPAKLPARLRTTKDAIMDRIEDSYEDASESERRLLLAALRTIDELERLSGSSQLQSAVNCETLGHVA